MNSVCAIVEGDGEVAAVPVLLRRMHAYYGPPECVGIMPPIRVRKDRFLHRDDEFRRHLQLAAAKCGEHGWILILLDADDDCPMALADDIRRRARHHVPHRRVAVVIANREFEAWFIAAAPSLVGVRGFSVDPLLVVQAEVPRNAKGWMRDRMVAKTYGETTDQPAFAARSDLEMAAANSRSFRKLRDEWLRHGHPHEAMAA